MLRPHFRDAVLYDLLAQMKGVKANYLKKKVAMRPQYHDGMIFLPYKEKVKGNDIPFYKWAICNLKSE